MFEPAVEAVHEHLLRSGAVEPVKLGGADERRWLDCDLASLAENRLDDMADPRDLDAARRADWQARATDDRAASLRSRSERERCYWLIEGGERAGTIALATSLLGTRSVHLSSFYLRPPYRGRGLGRRALAHVQEALSKEGLGLRLDTSWCWQRAVGFYMAVGLWLYMWKRELTFWWHADTPRPRVEVGEREASLSVQRGAELVVLARARRDGGVLTLVDAPSGVEKDRRLGEAYWHAPTTFALALAMHGWPLVRSEASWEQCYYADAGPPEALAYKIQIWEAWASHRGWPVRTPRIPELRYPTWEELEARWEAERVEFEAQLQRKRE